MNAFKLNIFPTQLFVFDFDDKDIEPVVNETIKLESQIKICNSLTPENGMFGNGYTDWSNPIRNKEYEKLLLKVAHELLLKKYGLNVNKPFVIMTYHPQTLEFNISQEKQINNIMHSLKNYEYQVLITSPGIEVGSNNLLKLIKKQMDICLKGKSVFMI